jgi:asparagine synthase (glutamine-hydrolysing)
MASLMHDERYRRHDLLKDDHCYLGYSAYAEYPMQSFDLGEVVVYLEGRLYGRNRDSNSKALSDLRESAFGADGRAQAQLADWVRRADGDFVVVLLHKRTGDFCFVNDVYGRLPLYYWRTSHRFILTRELRFITEFMGVRKFDRMALAQHLLVGYPLGERTLLEDVHRLPPASAVTIRKVPPRIEIDHHDRFNCEHKTDERRTVKDNAAELVDLFSRSCAARAAPAGNTVISLSGGFDSRSIAACFYKTRLPFRSATFLDPGRKAAPDVAVARRLAGLFRADWKLLTLEAPPARDTFKLLRMKNGLNPLYLSFLLAFFDELIRSWGPDLIYMSGEIGDRILPDRRPSVNFESIADIVDYLLAQDPKFPLGTVSALTGIDPADILAELRDHISSYPEEGCIQKHVHFTTYERIFKWLTEGEDRNRCFFWSATPYSAFEFFDAAMRCPDEQKSYYGLYREFLLQLSPAAAAIEHAGTGEAVTSDRFQTVRKALTLLQGDPDLRRRLQTVMGPPQGYDLDPMTIACLRGQLAHCDAIFEYLSGPVLRNVIDHYTHYTKESIDLLFTVTATIEERLTGKSVLEQCAPAIGASHGG